MEQKNKSTTGELRLARTLGIPEVALLGIGALLGGGIFTLLGHAAGLAGGGLVLAMLLGSAIAFINLNSYIALATTFPAAGGGYHWVTNGLGPVQGFRSASSLRNFSSTFSGSRTGVGAGPRGARFLLLVQLSFLVSSTIAA